MKIKEINDLVKEMSSKYLNGDDEVIHTIYITHGGEVHVCEKLFRKLFKEYERTPYTEIFDRLITYIDGVAWYCLIDKKTEEKINE